MRNYLIMLLALVAFTGFTAPTAKTNGTNLIRGYKLITVSGKIVDASSGEALLGATVSVAGKGITQADVNGQYQVTVNEKETLTFACIGYLDQSIKLKPGQTTLNVSLLVNKQTSLNEVVVRGYVKRNRDETTGSSYIITGKEVANNPVANTEQLLQGKVAGLNIQNGRKSKINGKAYYGGNAIEATKRLPAGIVEKVQIVNGYGNQTTITPQAFRPTPGDESYDKIVENQFIDPLSTPLSTLAVDVDGASYANVRRFINAGQLPPKDAVRIEEMINYFKYNLPEPTSGEPVAIQTELAAAPWNPQHQLVRIGLKAKNVKTDKLPPSNLVFLIDVSGSMGEPNKLPLVKTSMKMLVDQLRAIDNVAIVVYAGDVGVRLASTPGDQKEKIKDVIDQLGAGGGTAGGAGLMMAYQVAQKNFIKKGNNRIILSTDGDFNVGASSDKDMEQLIEEERKTGVSLSILGFGMGNYKDSKMELLADKGHGNYAYIDNITEATKSMVSEFGGTLFTIAKDVKLQVEFNPAKVQSYRLLGYEDRLMAKEDFNNDTKLGGDMGVGHTVTALYEIIPAGVKDSFTASVDPLKYQKPVAAVRGNNSPEVMTIKFRYKQPDSDKSKMESVTVIDNPLNAGKTSEDFRFAAAVAEYGMLLRDSQFKQNSKFDQLITMAKSAKGKDEDGYRAEFIRLAESTKNMMKTADMTAAK
ncbi:MAG: Ca-activated chloride channel family protein [Mucilaginibacter sp.]|nr:Ca-activated chloride channel family protein [Mucilaginibacter sp.]